MTEIIAASDAELNLPEFPGTITKVGWIPPEQDMPIDDWLFHTTGLLQLRRSIHFILGDWINYGKAKYGEKYSQALEWYDYAYGTLRNDCYVGRQIPIEYRREGLSWSHHYLVAKYELEVAVRVMDKAEERDWTSKQMDAIAKRWRRIFYNEGRKPLKDAAHPASSSATSVLPLYTHNPLPWRKAAKKFWRSSRAWERRARKAEDQVMELKAELDDLYDEITDNAIITHQRDDGRLEKVL
jgi:hypothetical protein